MKSQAHISGFTLLEMLLVMAIIAGIMLGIATYSQQRILQLREDRAVLQIQQILNAGLAYYLNNTQWPDSISTNLQGTATSAGYLPGPSSAVTISNPWGTSYIIGNTTMKTLSSTGIFAVCTTVNAGAATSTIATILASRLPMAYVANGDVSADCTPTAAGTNKFPLASTCDSTQTSCTVVATVNIPGQNLNNARSVNFAGIYHYGACVAAPKCPQNMTPQIFLAPVSVSGMDTDSSTVFPIHSFTAYYSSATPVLNPAACDPSDTYVLPCPGSGSDTFWRVCLQIITTNGPIVYNSNTGGAAATILAITRCSPAGEDKQPNVVGSPINVFSY